MTSGGIEKQPEGTERRNFVVIIVLIVGVLLLLGLCCCLLVMLRLRTTSISGTLVSSTRTPVVVERTPTAAPSTSPGSTRVVIPEPIQPADGCPLYQGAERVQYAIESGNVACLQLFIIDPGVVIVPSGVELHPDAASEFTHSGDSTLEWLEEGLARSNPSCYGYRYADDQVAVVVTGLDLDWEVMLGDYPADFEAVLFVLDQELQLPQGYVLSMIIGQWQGTLSYLEVSPCPR